MPHKGYFSPDVSDLQQRYCACVMHRIGAAPVDCLRSGFKGDCSVPYAICTSRVGREEKECFKYLNLEALPDNELRNYAILNEENLVRAAIIREPIVERMSIDDIFDALKEYQKLPEKSL
jgi:hypothetical protein